MKNIIIRKMNKNDAYRVLEIYNDAICNDDATYVVKCPSWKEWDDTHNTNYRFVALTDQKIVGFVVVSDIYCNPGFQSVGDVSIYVDRTCRKQGVGFQLLKYLISYAASLKQKERVYYTLQARIFTNNQASIALHEKAHFRKIGYCERILKKNLNWRDIYVYEKRIGEY